VCSQASGEAVAQCQPGQDAGEAAGAQPRAMAVGSSADPTPCQSQQQQSEGCSGRAFADS